MRSENAAIFMRLSFSCRARFESGLHARKRSTDIDFLGPDAFYAMARGREFCQRAAKGGGKLRGWKTYRKFGVKHLPKNVFGLPTYDTFSPPFFWRPSVISLKRKRHRPDQPHCLRPQKVVWRAPSAVRFPPPNSRDTFCPPLSRCPILFLSAKPVKASRLPGPLTGGSFGPLRF